MPAIITVTDAAGHVLFRRRATPEEVRAALAAAAAAEAQAQHVMDRVAGERREPPQPRERAHHVA